MYYYPTPKHIVSIIEKHIPKKYNNVLEPSVGEGALLNALGKKINNKCLTLIDIDINRIDKIKEKYSQSTIKLEQPIS